MYLGTNYNSYNTLFGVGNSSFGGLSTGKIDSSYISDLLKSAPGSIFGKNNLFSPVSQTGLQYVYNLKEASSGLSASISSLSSGSAFAKKAAVSSDKAAMSVSGGSAAYSFSSFPSVSVRIDRLATGQSNKGEAMQSGEATSLSGTQRFSIETGGRSYEFSVSAASGDTNKDIQQKMAQAINAANIGVTASVETDSESKTSALRLTAQSTGENNNKSVFTVKDLSGGAVAATGASNVEQNAQNALYSVNGGAVQSSQSNTVSLPGSVTAVFKKAGPESITVSRGTDAAFAEKQVNEFVNNYNKLYGATLNNSNDPKAVKLFNQLVNTSKIYASKLADIGIEFDGNGYMKINEEQFAKASESGKVEKFFTENNNKNYGFTNQMSRIARQVQNNTGSYVSRNTLTDFTSNKAQELLNALAEKNYMSAGFTQNMRDFARSTGLFDATGLLFDMLL